jgi:hypothetical protein
MIFQSSFSVTNSSSNHLKQLTLAYNVQRWNIEQGVENHHNDWFVTQKLLSLRMHFALCTLKMIKSMKFKIKLTSDAMRKEHLSNLILFVIRGQIF